MSEIFVKCLAPWEDRSDELDRIFAEAPENCTGKLEPGEYFLRKTIRIGGRKGLTIDGCGATFVLHCDRTQMAFDSTNPENPDGFIFTDCDDLTLRRLQVRTTLDFPAVNPGFPTGGGQSPYPHFPGRRFSGIGLGVNRNISGMPS